MQEDGGIGWRVPNAPRRDAITRWMPVATTVSCPFAANAGMTRRTRGRNFAQVVHVQKMMRKND